MGRRKGITKSKVVATTSSTVPKRSTTANQSDSNQRQRQIHNARVGGSDQSDVNLKEKKKIIDDSGGGTVRGGVTKSKVNNVNVMDLDIVNANKLLHQHSPANLSVPSDRMSKVSIGRLQQLITAHNGNCQAAIDFEEAPSDAVIGETPTLNGSEQKYLHKKFKRIASTVATADDGPEPEMNSRNITDIDNNLIISGHITTNSIINRSRSNNKSRDNINRNCSNQSEKTILKHGDCDIAKVHINSSGSGSNGYTNSSASAVAATCNSIANAATGTATTKISTHTNIIARVPEYNDSIGSHNNNNSNSSPSLSHSAPIASRRDNNIINNNCLVSSNNHHYSNINISSVSNNSNCANVVGNDRVGFISQSEHSALLAHHQQQLQQQQNNRESKQHLVDQKHQQYHIQQHILNVPTIESESRSPHNHHNLLPHHQSMVIGSSQSSTAAVESGDTLAIVSIPSSGSCSSSSSSGNNNHIGRNVCQYCNLNCTKPSVLEKHIRSHTNERPFPCIPCGFAFKTKSNLYKHCRSRAHLLRSQGGEFPPGQVLDDDLSLGSDPELSSSASGSDEISRTASPMDDQMLQSQGGSGAGGSSGVISNSGSITDKPYKPKFHKASMYNNKDDNQVVHSPYVNHCGGLQDTTVVPMQTTTLVSASNNINSNISVAPANVIQSAGVKLPLGVQHQAQPVMMSSISSTTTNVPYKTITQPAAPVSGARAQSLSISQIASQQMEDLHKHISKIIMDNEAIIEDVEPALQKKYHKITRKSRGNSLDLNATTAMTGSSKTQTAMSQLQQFQAKMNRDELPVMSRHNSIVMQSGVGATSTPVNVPLIMPSTSNSTAVSNRNKPASLQLVNTQTTQPLNLSMIVTNVSTVPPVSINNAPSIATSTLSALNLGISQHSAISPKTVQTKPMVHKVSSLTTLITNTLLKNTNIPSEIVESIRKHCAYGSATSANDMNVASHPQNPERSIIKGLLLDWKRVTAGGIAKSDTTNNDTKEDPISAKKTSACKTSTSDTLVNVLADEANHTCPVCKTSFQSADVLKYHTNCYCQGGSGISSERNTSSNDIAIKYSPNTLVNLARFKAKLTYSHHRNPSTLTKLAHSKLKPTKPKPENIVIVDGCADDTNKNAVIDQQPHQGVETTIQAPLPSPGPLLGKTRLVDSNIPPSSIDTAKSLYYDPKEDGHATKYLLSAATMTNTAPLNTSSCGASSYGQHRQLHIKTVPEPLVLSTDESNARAIRNANSIYHTSQQMPYAALEMFGGELQVKPKRSSQIYSANKRLMDSDSNIRRDSSGGSIVSESPGSDSEQQQLSIRTPGLFSGGKVEKVASSRVSPPITPLTPSLLVTPSQCTPSFITSAKTGMTHFQFPPINSITAYNPLTLPVHNTVVATGSSSPAMKLYGGRLIPDVPGIPGPDSMNMRLLSSPNNLNPRYSTSGNRSVSPNRNNLRWLKRSNSISPVTVPINVSSAALMAPPPPNGFMKPIKVEQDDKIRSPKERKLSGSGNNRSNIWSPANLQSDSSKRSFNFSRMADNVSPQKPMDEDLQIVAAKSQMQLHIDVGNHQSMMGGQGPVGSIDRKEIVTKFLRPTSLPLKPGTFTQKKHHGITPTPNTLPLISPETPRPSKTCIQMYINGQAYTYLGLKCSTKPFYCTVNKTQPIYLPHHIRTISMYSQWQVCAESCPDPMGLKPDVIIGLYDSRQRQSTYTSVPISAGAKVVASQSAIMSPYVIQNSDSMSHHHVKRIPTPPPVKPQHQDMDAESENVDLGMAGKTQLQDNSTVAKKTAPTTLEGASDMTKLDPQSSNANPISLFGGYESNEDYEYVKGRGSGRFVCETCGIRCRKPSMLKKHIRTHTNIRPFTCPHCCFSFKTKGNLTKHMKSKSHAKKCEELGVNPMALAEDMMEQGLPRNLDGTQMVTIPGDSDSDDDTDADEQSEASDTEENIRSRLPQEQEAARGLLSLSMTPPINISATSVNADVPCKIETATMLERIGEDLSVKTPTRPVEKYGTQKVTFEFPRPEQYYSNPTLQRPSAKTDHDHDSNTPMDLTKPRESQTFSHNPLVITTPGEHTDQVVTKILGPAGLLSSLVSITDKIPLSNLHHHNVAVHNVAEIDENALLQQYLTERAMHGTKMKQHQRSLILDVPNPYSLSVSSELILSNSPIAASNSRNGFMPVQIKLPTGISSVRGTEDNKRETLNQDKNMGNDHKTGIETLADIAANSMKLDVVQSTKPQIATATTASTPDRNSSAKSVASEFLKIASQIHGPVKSDREDGESSSDQEPLSDSSGRKRTDSASEMIGRNVVVINDRIKTKPEFLAVNINSSPRRISAPIEDGRSMCDICSKQFQKPSQLKLHMNIHYIERKYRCEPCGVSFRMQGHLHKHERSVSHHNKVSMTSTFGVATTTNPRPFKCSDCRVAFRIHGHLAKHLRSKMHVLRLECLCKIPFGTYAEIERAGISLTDIDTTDCDNSLASLQMLARQLHEKDPTKLKMHEPGAERDMASAGALLIDGSNKTSGEESDAEEYGLNNNGYMDESLSGNENNERNRLDETRTSGMTIRRKFGTLLHANDGDDQRDESGGEERTSMGADGGGSMDGRSGASGGDLVSGPQYRLKRPSSSMDGRAESPTCAGANATATAAGGGGADKRLKI